LILPLDYNPNDFLSQLEIRGEGVSHIVFGFSACLGVPRHYTNDPHFIYSSLENLDHRHDILLDLVEVVADEEPFVALHLLQVCGIERFGHIIRAVLPLLVYDFHL